MVNQTQNPTVSINFDPDSARQCLEEKVDRIDQIIREPIKAAARRGVEFGVNRGFQQAVARLGDNEAAGTVVREIGTEATNCATNCADPVVDTACDVASGTARQSIGCSVNIADFAARFINNARSSNS